MNDDTSDEDIKIAWERIDKERMKLKDSMNLIALSLASQSFDQSHKAVELCKLSTIESFLELFEVMDCSN